MYFWSSHPFPLSLLQMPEEQAFSVLVKIMFDYGLRELFKQNFEDLHCKFYQLERLMQVKRESSLHLPIRVQDWDEQDWRNGAKEQ